MGWLFGKTKDKGPTETDSLIQSLRNSDLSVVCNAAERAGLERLRVAVPALVQLLYSGNKSVIAAVAHALGETGDVRAIQHLGEAGYAHSYSGGLPGFLTVSNKGEVVEPADDDVWMDKVINEAMHKLINLPGAQQYVAQLGRIKMYTLGDFLRSADIYIDPDIQAHPAYPFTMRRAEQFFKHFQRERFAFEGDLKSIRIYSAKENLPRHSFASGWLYAEPLNELEKRGGWPEWPVGSIQFEFGGNATVPYVSARPEPNWPRPSIVRRVTIGAGVRFEELP